MIAYVFRNFQDNFETRKRSYISAFSIYMTVPLRLCANRSSPNPEYFFQICLSCLKRFYEVI